MFQLPAKLSSVKICAGKRCLIEIFFKCCFRWPSHVKDSKLHCHRPIILQSTLRDVDSLIWLDIDYRLTSSDLDSWMTAAQESGVMAWSEINPATTSSQQQQQQQLAPVATTSLTHPKMFTYFDKRKYEDYAFQHMVGLGSVILYNHEKVHQELMLPWLKCVLTEACVNPLGAQDSGCRFDKKPQFRYSGCHRYDASAFNIVLGEIFNFQENLYLGDKTFFRKVDQNAPQQESGNFTDSLNTVSSESLAGLEM